MKSRIRCWQIEVEFLFYFTVKSEVKLEDRINGMNIKQESHENLNIEGTSRLEYPNSIDEFFDRTEPQLFLMQVRKIYSHLLKKYQINH